MALRLLGPLEVEGRPRLSPRDRVVLSALVVRGGQVVSAEQLADALWGDEPPASWTKVVQGCIARIRRALGPAAVQTVGTGYRLALGPDEVDVRRFEGQVARGRALAAEGDHERAAAVLGSALALWRGRPLPDLEGWPEGRVEAGRLDELRHAAAELRLGELAAAGYDVVAEAAALVEAEPLRESRWHLLALALYRAGRQSDALGALRRARHTLREDLGLDPGPALVELERAILEHDPSLQAAPAPARPGLDVCPYKGLVVYDRADAEAFFGRDREIDACLQALRAGPLLVLTGPSGSGKSSLARAGVVPALERAGQHVTVVVPGADPLSVLTTATARRRRDAVLVVDQLEELFTASHPAAVVSAALDRLVAAAAAGTKVVLVVRADQVAGLARDVELARLTERGLHLVTAMSPDELRTAIEGPAHRAGLRLEAGLVELLLREVQDEPGALPLLSHALAETWLRREGGVLTVGGYHASGGIRGAVARTAEELWLSLDGEQRAAMRALLLRLASAAPGGHPVAVRLPVDAVPVDRRQVLELLTSSRLVTRDESSVTVAHEALLREWPRLRSWLDDDAAGQQVLRHLTVTAEDWHARGRPASELYRGGRLSAATEWRRESSPDLSAVEHDFIDASEALAAAELTEAQRRGRQQVRQNHRLRAALAGTAAALVVALVAGTVAVQQRQDAADGERAAQTDQLVATSVALRQSQRDLAALLAVAAHRIRPDAGARGALIGLLAGQPGFLGYRDIRLPAGTPSSAAALPDGSLLVATTAGALAVVDPATGRTRTVLDRGQPALTGSRVALSRDARTAAVVRWRGSEAGGGRAELVVYDVASSSVRSGPVRLPLDPGAVAVGPDGRHVAVTGYDGGRLLVFDATAAELPELRNVDDTAAGVVQPAPLPASPDDPTQRHTAAVTFDAQGRVLVGSETGVLRTVDPASGAVLQRWAGGAAWATSTLLTTSEDGEVVVSAGRQTVVRWDPRTREPLWSTRLDDSCTSLVIMTTGTSVLCGGGFGYVTELDLASGLATPRRYDLQRGPLAAVVVAPTADQVVLLSGTEPVLASWDATGRGPAQRSWRPADHVEHDPTGAYLLMAGPETYPNALGFPRPATRVADADDGEPVVRLGADQVTPVWTGAAGQAAVWDELGEAYVVDLRTRERVRRLDGGFGAPPRGGVATPDGRWLLAWGDEFGLVTQSWIAWDLRTGESVAAGRLPSRGSGALTPDGRTMLWSAGDELLAYDVGTGRRIATRRGVAAMTVAPDGTVVASLSDGRLVTLRRSDLRVRAALLPGRPGVMQQLDMTADSALLAARGEDGRVRLVDVVTGTLLGDPVGLGDGVTTSVSLHPNGRSVVLGGPQETVEWDLRPGRLEHAACELAGRGITRQEWAVHVGDLAPYDPTCPAA